jgi:hypothetical protein
MAAWMPSISKAGFSDAPWTFGGSTVDSLIGQIFGVLALGVLVGFVVVVFALLTHKQWARQVLIASAAASLVVILSWANVWLQGSMVGAVLVDVAVLVALLPSWGVRFAHAF